MSKNAVFNKRTNLSFFFLFFFSSMFSQECGYIYVTPGGASSGAAATKANPASLAYGLSLVTSTNNHLRVASGTYNLSNALNIPSNIIIEGGFNSSTWVKSNATATILYRDNSNIIPSPNRLIALAAINATNFRLLDLTINMADAAGDGTSTYGIYLSGCSNYLVSRCIVNTGDATGGNSGNPGQAGIAGAAGQNGQSGQEEGNCCKQGGVGGCCSFGASFAGGDGGTGADWGYFEINPDTILGYPFCYADEFETNDGFAGINGFGLGFGLGGKGGRGLCELSYELYNCSTQVTNNGEPGGNGAVGTDGFNGTQGNASYSGGYYVPGTGTIGQAGMNGAGGGGGGGGGAKGCEPSALDPQNCDTLYHNAGSGGGGGGGGEGGQGGTGGTGGSGGGGSFAIFIWLNGQNGVIRDCYLNLGTAGYGGVGGTGGIGGVGGTGGQGGNTGSNGCCNSCNVGEGGDGGAGGNGGDGGNGGKGSDGVSVTIYQQPGGSPALVSDAYNPFEPDITVSFTGCSNSQVVFSTTATGNLNWIFGYGSTPLTSDQPSDTVEYASGGTGFRSITLIVDGVPFSFGNFISVKQDFTPPVITASDTIICSGTGLTLSTSSNALSYNWSIPGGSVTSSTVQSPGTVNFAIDGVYTVTLTTTSCCGTHIAKQKIYVIEYPPLDLGPDTSFCYTDPMPVLDAGNPGASYTWKFNGSPIGGNTMTLQTFQPGSYSVLVSYGACFSSDTITLDVYTNLPVDLGDDIYLCPGGIFPVLDAGIPGMTSYSWRVEGNPVGTNAQTIQSTVPGTYTVDLVSPTGCTGTDSVDVIISDPTVNLGLNQTVCSNEAMPVLNAGNPGSTYFWYLNGSSVGGNTQTILATGGGIWSAVIINQYGCTASDSMTLTVLSALTANFTAPASATVNTTVSFTDLSSPAPISWNWNFGDATPNVFIQNPTHVYTAGGTYSIFLIAGNGLCYDTVVKTININNDCATLGLDASFLVSDDTIYLSGLGMIFIINTSTNAATYSWNFGDGSNSILDNPSHTYISEGVYTITLTAININCSDQATATVVVLNSPEGLYEIQSGDLTFHIYPNPFYDEIHISYYMKSEEQIAMDMYNIMGEKIILLADEKQQSGFHKVTIDANDLGIPEGVYFIRVLIENTVFYRKIIRVIPQ